jgi:hypothetical protein
MIRAALSAERRRHAHASARIRTTAPRTKVQEWSLSFDAAGCVIAATSRVAFTVSCCWRPCEEPAAGRLSWLSAGDRRWRCRGAAFMPCRCVTCTGTYARVTPAAPSETEEPGSSSKRACEIGWASATAPAADGSTRALTTGMATGADAAGEPATLSAGALAVAVVVAARTGSAAGASAVEAAPTTAVTAGASAAVAGGTRVRDGKNTIGSTYPC